MGGPDARLCEPAAVDVTQIGSSFQVRRGGSEMSNQPKGRYIPAQQVTRSDQGLGDQLTWFTGALVLIWTGCLLLIKNAGEVLGVEIQYASAWILTGAGVLLWIEAILRLAIPAYQHGVGTRIILGTIFVIVGLGEVIEFSLWPILLIAIGAVMIGAFFVYPRRY
jgi:hypothetical protein